MYYYPNGGNSFNQFAPPQQQYGIKGHPVSSLEEVRAAQVDFDGSLFVYPDIANKRIYTKQINLDGTASLKAYCLVENVNPPEKEYVTKQEFEEVIRNLENKRKGEQHESNVSTASTKPAISF